MWPWPGWRHFFITRFPFYFDFADWEIFFMVLPAGKFENPLTCPNIDIGALELTWRGCAISTKDKNIVQRYGIIHLWNYHPCWRDIFGACNGQSLGNQASYFCKCNPSCSMLNGIWSNLQQWIVSCTPICGISEHGLQKIALNPFSLSYLRKFHSEAGSATFDFK